MANFTYNLGVPPLSGLEYNPYFDELVNFNDSTVIGTPTSTSLTVQFGNGLRGQVIGTGFTYDSGKEFTGGTISSIKIFLANGTTQVMTWTGLNLDAQNFIDFSTPYGGGRALTAWIANGNDVINGGAGWDDLLGFAGDDTINGGDGDDYMDGGAGTDTYAGGNGYDQIAFSTSYYDPAAFRGVYVDATAGTLIDPYGNTETFTSVESFRGAQFADQLIGSSADEQFMGLGGRDVMNGGGGFDVVRYHRDSNFGGHAGVNVNLATGVAIDGFGRQDTLISMEGVRGTEQADTLVGSSVANQLRGDGGNDYLDGGAGGDTMQGGAGNDIYVVDSTADRVDETIGGNLGIDTIRTALSYSLSSTTQIRGTVENLLLTGTGAVNGTGNAVNNSLTGNGAANTLSGLAGNDILNGAAGNDFLYGGAGNDTLIGGLGNDNFVFNTYLSATANVDRITDFSVLYDTIRLENAVFTALTATGTLAAAAFVKNTTGLAMDASDRIIYETDTGKVFYDSNGSAAGGSVLIATLTANLAVTNADFYVI